MPELPEVETVRKSIFSKVEKKQIKSVTLNHRGVLKNSTPEDFCQFLQGEVILTMERRGKYLIFHLAEDKAMILHLRMTGQFVYFEDKLPDINHCHVVINFDVGGLYYRDVRRFGGFWIGNDILTMGSGIENLGPEPLSDEYNWQYLYAITKKKHAPFKSIILDQSIVAGVGNIYADEISFAAGINPLKPGNTLTEAEVKSAVKATKDVLITAISKRGTTFSDYRDGYGEKGGFQDYLKVFQRGGLDCPKCGTIIEKTKCGGRSTSYCPKCQPYKKERLVIGLTGGIASGKTLASDYLENLGAEIIDADIIAREIMVPNSTVMRKIADTFGKEYLEEDGSLNRTLLRSKVFQSDSEVKKLNAITHPAIRRVIGNRLRKSKNQIVVLVAPLLIEGKYIDMCDEVWLLYVREEQQLDRLINRDGISIDLAHDIINKQLSYEKKAKAANLVIDNSTTKGTAEIQIKEEFEKRKNYFNDQL